MGVFSKLGSSYKKFIGGYSPEHVIDKTLGSQFSMNNLIDYISHQQLIKSAPIRKGHAYLTDPDGQIAAMGYMDRPYALSYDTLRDMSVKNAVIAAVINTRVNQVSTFTRPARFDKSGIGFEITLRDPKRTPEKAEEKEMLDIEKFLEYTGYYKNPLRDSFDTFIRKITRDRLTYDQVNFEIVPDRAGRPAEFYAVDASSIRAADTRVKADPNETEDEGGRNVSNNLQAIAGALGKGSNNYTGDISDIKYVQLVNGVIVAGFDFDELAFGVANPRTDIRVQPYGFSELEALVKQVTAHLYAEDYNERYFSNGGTTKGILNLKGTADNPISPAQMEAFKRQYTAQTLGNYGAWKTPVVSVPGMEYINVQQSNREMEFEKWMNYLINCCCLSENAIISLPNNNYCKIKDIVPGDRVISHTGKIQTVVNIQRRSYCDDWYTFYYGDKKIESTYNHPFYVSSSINGKIKLVEACQVKLGYYFVTPVSENKYVYTKINKIDIKKLDYPITVYNFEVENDHSYIANGIAVHNCAVYQIDPAEVNFPNRGGAGNSGGGGLGNGGIQDRIQYSRDKGLRPLLRFLEDMINQYIIYRFSDKYIFKFIGVNAKNEQEVIALQEKQAKVFKTINEVRADNDLKPIPDGDVIEDPYFVQYTLNAQAQRLQQTQMEQQQESPSQQQQGVPSSPMTPIQGSSAGRVNNISPNSAQGTNENTGASSGNNNIPTKNITSASQLDKPKAQKSFSFNNPSLNKDKYIQIDVEDIEEQK